MIFEFRNYSYWRGDPHIKYFRGGYIHANSIDQAVSKLSKEIYFPDDYITGNYVREAPHVAFPSEVNILTTKQYISEVKSLPYYELNAANYDEISYNGLTYTITDEKELPYWALTSPKDWEKEGFSSGTPSIRVM